MKNKRPRWVLVTLAVILTVSFGLRLNESLTPGAYISKDEGSYRTLAINLYLHGAYEYRYPPTESSQPERWPPGAPALFAGSFFVAGEVSPSAARITQALICTLLVFVVYLLATVLAQRREAGLIAAALTAIYPPLVKIAADLLSEPLGALLIATAAFLTVKSLDKFARVSYRRLLLDSGLIGLTVAAAVLTRTDYLFLPAFVTPIYLFYSWQEGGRLKWNKLRRVAPVVVMLLVFVAGLTPWTVRNSVRRGHFVPITTGGATPMFVGTYLPGDGTRAGVKLAFADEAKRKYPSIRNVPARKIPAGFAIGAVAARHPDLNRNDAIALEARRNLERYALGQPFDFTWLAVKKIPRMWVRPFDSGHKPRASLRLIHLAYLIFGLIGLTLLMLKRSSRRGAVLILTFLAYGTLFHLLVVATPRYNLPLMPLLIAAGAAGFRPRPDPSDIHVSL